MKNKNKLVALVGMCGSGKSVVTEEFEDFGYQVVHFGDATMDKLNEASLLINESNERYMREKLRADLGMAAFAIVNLEKIKRKLEDGPVIVDGLYSWAEYKVLKEKFPSMEVIAIVADKKIRYDRLSKRNVRPLSIKEAESRDNTEIENIEKGGPIAAADIYITNNGNTVDLLMKVKDYIRKSV